MRLAHHLPFLRLFVIVPGSPSVGYLVDSLSIVENRPRSVFLLLGQSSPLRTSIFTLAFDFSRFEEHAQMLVHGVLGELHSARHHFALYPFGSDGLQYLLSITLSESLHVIGQAIHITRPGEFRLA